MRVCLILEGCYPYVFGGVSSWTHQYIKAMPEVEFVLWCIGAKAENRGKFTETMKRTGKTAEELSHSKNELTRK